MISREPRNDVPGKRVRPRSRHLWLLVTAACWLVLNATNVHANNSLRAGNLSSTPGGGSSSSSSSTTSQTSTAATSATSQTAQTSALAQRAQAALQRSTQALQAMQAAQSATHNLSIPGASSVANGLAPTGLVPGVSGTDAANPTTVATSVPVIVNSNGTASVTLAANTALTLPSNLSGSEQITVSGSGTVGTVTTGGTITSLTGGTAITIAPGSTVSLTNGGTITFAANSVGAIPTSVSTYTYGTSGTGVPDSWTGIGGLSQSVYAPGTGQSTGQTTVTITQNAQQALLTWQSFNVGSNTLLDFNQSAGGANVGQWVAINKVAPSIAPSQILGSIQAPGQVYVINQNGIIFGGASQVNTHALVASSLPINDNLIDRGLLNNPDQQFLFSQLNISAGSQGPTPAFTPTAAPTTGQIATQDSNGNATVVAANPNGQDGDVIVEPGAQITSPTTPEHVGGRVALIGPNVDNGGTISTPDGQTILAAGLQVGFDAHDANDPSLRGLDTYVGAVTDPSYDNGATGVAGTALNTGLIESPRANITMAGSTVDQAGVIDSSTSVALNGSIDLEANYGAVVTNPLLTGQPPAFNFSQSGVVTLGPGSLTQILPETSSTDRVVGSTLALNSQINIQGEAIDLASGSTLLAPDATVNIQAGQWLFNSPTYDFVYSDGQVYMDSNAIIDVSGSEDVSASVSENIISVQLRGTELANSPLQRDGPLRGQTVVVDINEQGVYDGTSWVGSPIGDLSGYVNLVQRTVGELTTSGGTVNIQAGKSVVMQPGSFINIEGGWIDYQGATVNTTQVVGTNGQVYDISNALPNITYSGIANGYTTTSTKYGITQTYTNQVGSTGYYEAGYIQGGNGGSLSISAPSMALDGSLYGGTVAGARQRVTVPTPSSLHLDFISQQIVTQAIDDYSPTPPDITFGTSTSQTSVSAFSSIDSSGATADLPADRVKNVYLSPDLISASNIGSIDIEDPNGNITIPTGNGITTAFQGSITLSGANVDVESNIIAPSGTITINAYGVNPYLISTGSEPSSRGQFILGSGVTLSVAGLLVDDRVTSISSGVQPLSTAGGSIQINAANATLETGSLVDASGGAYLPQNGSLTYGNGGSISINTGQDGDVFGALGGPLVLDGTLQAYSGATGGSLTLEAPAIQVGGTTNDPNTLLLNPSFFTQGGFDSFTMKGVGEVSATNPSGYTPGFLLAAGTTLGTSTAPIATESYMGSIDSQNNVHLNLTLLPQSLRTPVSLNFGALGIVDGNGLLTVRGDVVIGANSSIVTDPLASVTLKGNTVTVLGSIQAPGGSISVNGSQATKNITIASPTEPLVTVDLGSQSLLSTAGTVKATLNNYGFSTGQVLNGGTISVSGNIVAEAGAVLDVSGTSAVVDEFPGSVNMAASASFQNQMVPTLVASNGGTITLSGGEELFTDATLKGAAGNSSAEGGSLVVQSGRFYLPSDIASPNDVTLTITQSGPTIPDPFAPGTTVVGSAVTDGLGNALTGQGYFAADSLKNSGFDSLTFNGVVQFAGAVSLQANRSINIGTGGFMYADSTVSLNAPYVAIGQTFQGPLTLAEQELGYVFSINGQAFQVPPTFGTGNLSISASLIDVGNLSLQGIGTLNLTATNGDIRGDGTLDVAGNVTLTTGQVYPTTETTFTIAAYDYTTSGGNQAGSVTVNQSGGVRPLPLSAGGTLNIYATEITQAGTLRAPIGTINLGSGITGANPVDPLSGLAVDPAQQVVLAPGSVTSVSAIDPTTGQGVVIPYGTNLNGVSWIDPSGQDITASGTPAKQINISALNVNDQSGSTIDISGGGDLLASEFVTGTGGTVDILSSSTSFAVIPGYAFSYAPDDSVYSNSSLAVGQQIYLNASSGLPAGVYTLLPARYALLPGAFLITPQSSKTVASSTAVTQSDGSQLVSGYTYNGLDTAQTSHTLYSEFEVASQSVVLNRAEYDDLSGNTFLKQGAISNNTAVPRLPVDAGQLVLAATQTMTVDGTLLSQTTGGLGSLVDISSPTSIDIVGSTETGRTGSLILDAGTLSSFNAGSLLIGGYRTETTSGIEVTVTTNDLEVNNAGTALVGQSITLVSSGTLTLDPGSDIEATDTLSSPAPTLYLSGDGALVRVTNDPSAQIVRSNVNPLDTAPALTLGANVKLVGQSLTLDSTATASLDSQAQLQAGVINLNGGNISLELETPTTGQSVPSPSSLTLSGNALAGLESETQQLSLLSYTTVDIYGSGQIGGFDSTGAFLAKSLTIQAAGIRSFNQDGGSVVFNAQTLVLNNNPNGTTTPVTGTTSENLVFNAQNIQIGGGTNGFSISGFTSTSLTASSKIMLQDTGSLNIQGDLNITTPVIVGASGTSQTIAATGTVTLQSPSGTSSVTSSGAGLGGSLQIEGANIVDSTAIVFPSGSITLHAETGDVSLAGATLDVSGQAETLYDATSYTNGGTIDLVAHAGNVTIDGNSNVSVAAASGGGNAGSLTVQVPNGTFSVASGVLKASGGSGGEGGTFSLDTQSLPSLTALGQILNAASFTENQSFRVRNGNVSIDGTDTAQTFDLSTDAGDITVTGTINASGTQGGTIDLVASGSVTLASGSLLTVEGQTFNDAGKGGSVSLEAGSEVNGNVNSLAMVNINSGSTINLGVDSNTASSQSLGDFTGTLHIRAPQNAAGTDVQVASINGTITGASSVVVEGYQVYNLANAAGSTITSTVEQAVLNNGNTFLGTAGTASSTYNAMFNRLFSGNTALQSVASIQVGAEIINPLGDLTLAKDWDLSTYRFGPSSTPGDLTLRATGNLIFNGTLSDGFKSSQYTATLLAQNTAIPLNAQSWSYRLVAGADFSAANYTEVAPLASLNGSGSLELGINDNKIGAQSGSKLTTANTLSGSSSSSASPIYYQVIRTGTGDINIAAGNNVYLLNQFATIYTAGVQASAMAQFDVPVLKITGSQGALGSVQESPFYPAQYEMAGGNVTIAAQNDIAHMTRNSSNQLVADSEKEMPNNWLYRRGYVNPATGQFGATANGDIASTSWWIDFSNFFEGVGALGGGNVTLNAGHDVSNVDAVAPTNMRVSKDASTSLELGGGDVTVIAGHDINGGVYYVERGQGTLTAGDQILTNATRSVLDQTTLSTDALQGIVPDSDTWLPTTLFLGKGDFDITASSDIELGPVANVFLLPEGTSNTFWDKTYFSTYATTDAVNVTSLTGSVTLKESVTLPSETSSLPLLEAWLQNVELLSTSGVTSVSNIEPWLRIDETAVSPFTTLVSLLPSTLNVSALGGDIDIDGNLTLMPSPTGNVDLLAEGAVNGLQINGVSNGLNYWSSSTINLSDANIDSFPSVLNPDAYEAVSGTAPSSDTSSRLDFSTLDALFAVSGSTEGDNAVLQTKEELHGTDPNSPANDPLPLHAEDPNPVHIYSGSGNISGFTLFAGKSVRVVAGQDLNDISIYAQNNNANDISVIAAGRDITVYDATSPLRTEASAIGNAFDAGLSAPQAGDIQIGGPGTVEVLAGRNFSLGVGPNNSDGTGTGLTTIGKTSDPYLPFDGASVIAAAGVGVSYNLGSDPTHVDFPAFIDAFLNPSAGDLAARYLPDLETIPAFADLLPANATDDQIWSTFESLPTAQQNQLALDIFYLVLRDAGRDHNQGIDTNYTNAYAAIAALFPSTSSTASGDISLTSREIKTTNGGDISLLAPAGQLTVGIDIAGNQAIDQGILTQDGGNINIFTKGDVNVGTSRIFTLHGGNEILWSTDGNIAAGASSKTVQSAPPTRVLVDPQSGDVETDLAGLATGGGIGVLETVVGVPPGDVDLVAPTGTVDAGDAGIRVSGNINIAAARVVNAGNIQVGGSSAGVPVVSTPNLGALAAGNSAAGSTANSANEMARDQMRNQALAQNNQDIPSIITVDVLGYGGGDSD